MPFIVGISTEAVMVWGKAVLCLSHHKTMEVMDRLQYQYRNESAYAIRLSQYKGNIIQWSSLFSETAAIYY